MLCETLSLDDLPPLTPEEPSAMVGYLERLVDTHATVEAAEIFIPSLAQLAGYFKTPMLDVYNALLTSRQHNYDFILQGLDSPITIWKKSQ